MKRRVMVYGRDLSCHYLHFLFCLFILFCVLVRVCDEIGGSSVQDLTIGFSSGVGWLLSISLDTM